MHLRLQMIDTDTGEIICTRYKEYACSFGVKNDAGFRVLMEWCMSAVRGVRTTDHKSIELRFHFAEKQGSLPIPFGMNEADARNQALEYVHT